MGNRSFSRDESGLDGKAGKSPASMIDILAKPKEFREFVVEIVKAAKG